jgi:hypothetical protein
MYSADKNSAAISEIMNKFIFEFEINVTLLILYLYITFYLFFLKRIRQIKTKIPDAIGANIQFLSSRYYSLINSPSKSK